MCRQQQPDALVREAEYGKPMSAPATINKLLRVIQYGYFSEPVLPSGLNLPESLIRPVENIAICELNGGYVPVFCTRDWQMVPAGFDATLEQN